MQRIGFIAFPNFAILALSTVSVFEFANSLAREPLYDLHLLSETGGRIQTSSGLSVETEMLDETMFDTLIVLATLEHRAGHRVMSGNAAFTTWCICAPSAYVVFRKVSKDEWPS
jgi:transcriptional regulator GlxA family with amidase domain